MTAPAAQHRFPSCAAGAVHTSRHDPSFRVACSSGCVCSGYRPARAMPESTRSPRRRPPSVHRALLSSEAGGGIALMVAAAAALAMANSGLASAYFATLHAYLGPLSILHCINAALLPVFFLMLGLEIKREFIAGHLSTWPRRILPGLAASGGMIAPAVIDVGLNAGTPRPPRAGLAQDLPHRPCDYRRPGSRRDHRGLLHCRSVLRVAWRRRCDARGSRGAQQGWRRASVGVPRPWIGALVVRAQVRGSRDTRRRCPRHDDPAQAVTRPTGRSDLSASCAGARVAALGRLRHRSDLRLRQRRRIAGRHRYGGGARSCLARDRGRAVHRQAGRGVCYDVGGREARLGGLPRARFFRSGLWRLLAMRHRVHHEPVHRIAGVPDLARVTGRREDRGPYGLDAIGNRRCPYPVVRACWRRSRARGERINIGGCNLPTFRSPRLQHRKVSGFVASDDLTGVDARLPISVSDIWAIAHEPTCLHEFSELVDRRAAKLIRQRDELFAMNVIDGITTDQQCVNVLQRKCGERGLDARFIACAEQLEFQTQLLPYGENICALHLSLWRIRIVSTAKLFPVGANSRSRSRRLGARSAEMIVIPVAFPPGRDKLAT